MYSCQVPSDAHAHMHEPARTYAHTHTHTHNWMMSHRMTFWLRLDTGLVPCVCWHIFATVFGIFLPCMYTHTHTHTHTQCHTQTHTLSLSVCLSLSLCHYLLAYTCHACDQQVVTYVCVKLCLSVQDHCIKAACGEVQVCYKLGHE